MTLRLKADGLACERGGRVVFRAISFAVRASELMQITGPNGSGKSSLLRLIAGLNEASEGSIQLDGGHADLSIGQQAHLVAHDEAVKSALTAAENISFWSAFLGGGETEAALAAFDLTRLSGYPAGFLSAGQKRRLALTRLVAVPRAIWLLDEPTVGLDQVSLQRLEVAMAKHLAKGGLIVAATHVSLGLEPDVRLDLGGRS